MGSFLPSVKRYGRVVGVLGEVEISGSAKLFPNHELQKLETSQELVLDFQKVTLEEEK